MCCGRCCTACETPVEYAWRKRETDLADILGMAVERELTEKEREVIKDYYFGGLSGDEIARKECISRAAVSSAKKRAEKKLKRALYYLKVYMTGATGGEVYFDSEAAVLAARQARGGPVGKRIADLRTAGGFTLEKAAALLGISVSRLSRLESGAALPDAEEIRRICAACGISYGELLG